MIVNENNQNMRPQIYLASRSPRRSELLSQIGVIHKTVPAEVDETPRPREAPAEYVLRLALEKAEAGRSALNTPPEVPVLAADTAVVVDNEILGKPGDREEALAMMGLLSGRSHKVLTGVALAGRNRESRLSVSRVTFRTLTDAEAAAYWLSGEPADKAGGYGIQGLGAIFISHLEGSFSGVMGLPLFETAQLLQAEGIELLNAHLAKTDTLAL
jgi:septum formation protein